MGSWGCAGKRQHTNTRTGRSRSPLCATTPTCKGALRLCHTRPRSPPRHWLPRHRPGSRRRQKGQCWRSSPQLSGLIRCPVLLRLRCIRADSSSLLRVARSYLLARSGGIARAKPTTSLTATCTALAVAQSTTAGGGPRAPRRSRTSCSSSRQYLRARARIRQYLHLQCRSRTRNNSRRLMRSSRRQVT